jgi:hypothetical protein
MPDPTRVDADATFCVHKRSQFGENLGGPITLTWHKQNFFKGTVFAMDRFFKAVEKHLCDNNERVIFHGDVPTGKSSRRKFFGFAATSFGALTFKGKKLQKRYYWFDLTAITLDDWKMTLKFGQHEALYSPCGSTEDKSTQAAYLVIMRHLPTILTADELAKIERRVGKDVIPPETVDANRGQPFVRLVARVHQKESQARSKRAKYFPREILLRFEQVIEDRQPKFVLNSITNDHGAIEMLLECLNLMPWVQSLVIPGAVIQDFKQELKRFIMGNSCVKRLYVQG